ncbi:MAG: inositol monophosphatase family protein [Burkholderiales bacterium]
MSPALDPVLAVATRAARAAASILLDAARDLKRLPSYARNHADVATHAEIEAEDAIVATLRAAFPDHAILGKESGHIDGARERQGARWLVDPLDGGVNFLHGFPFYAVSLALVRGSEVTHAVVLDPVHDELFTAVAREGASCNGAAIGVSSCIELDEALVGTMMPPPASPRLPTHHATWQALAPRCAGVRHSGACALDLAHVGAGRLDGFWMLDLKAWDIAAGALIVTEAGGRIGDFAGGMNFLKTAEVVASTPGIFNALRDTVLGAR